MKLFIVKRTASSSAGDHRYQFTDKAHRHLPVRSAGFVELCSSDRTTFNNRLELVRAIKPQQPMPRGFIALSVGARSDLDLGQRRFRTFLGPREKVIEFE